jgi:hypothetical protein
MTDLFDYMFLYLMSLFLAVLKITAIISWSWWVVAVPTIIAFLMHFIVTFASL